jgi:phage terminase large subunit
MLITKTKINTTAILTILYLGDKAMQQLNKEKKNNPHLYNLNFDPQLNGKIIHILKKQETEIGNRKGSDSDICMIGPG